MQIAPPTQIRLKRELLQDLDLLAQALGLNRTETVNHLLREYIAVEARRIAHNREETLRALRSSNRVP